MFDNFTGALLLLGTVLPVTGDALEDNYSSFSQWSFWCYLTVDIVLVKNKHIQIVKQAFIPLIHQICDKTVTNS